MAYNEKLVFQIGFDLDSAVKDATSEWKRVQRELEAAINARPISISMDTRGLERFNTFVERTYASLEDLQDLFPEVFKETKDGEGITKRFQAMETSINAVSKEMRNLEKVWNNLSQAEKFDDDGNLTERAQELKRAYVELYQSQKTQGQTLQEITKEAINLANQEYEAQQRKKKQEEDFIRLLNLEETTLEKLQAKQGAWKQKLSQTEIGTSDWSNAIAEVQRLETKMKDLQKQIKGVATETKKTSKAKVDIDTSTFAGKLKDLENRWKALNAEQRKGAEGQALRAEWRKLSEEAGRYTSTLRSAVSAEDRLANAKKKTTQSTHEQNSAYKTQGGYLQRLFQRMVAYASVTQAFSFIRNIREVTAQFELQRVALGSIIGDLNEANAMFEQIKAAAVKSPFQIKELVTYTKQLAAYKIESDELFETTQRLADISASLGVGMERLVLAYGQIRATGYLRASEVRQLTEAGIPIVEELAKKMSQLRGETVSAAEVMGLISERAISFGMVKEVFDDMTSAGGMFYKMQEKQAETLAGQWNNLKDSIAIMYEEIGNTEGVNNSIKGTIGLVKSLAENWRTVGVVMITALEGYGVYKGFSKTFAVLTASMIKLDVASRAHTASLRKMALAHQRVGALGKVMALNLVWKTKLLKKAAQATNFWYASMYKLGAFLAGNIWNIALIGIGALVAKIVSARIEANRLNKELERIGAEGDVQSRTQVNNFERLAKVIRDSADGSLRQTEALKEMKRAYGEFLPSQDKEIINLVRAKEGYEAVSQAIREKIALQVQEQKINAVTSEYSKIISDYFPDLKKLLEPEGIDVSRVYSALKTAIEDGSLTLIGNVKEDAEAINAILEKELGITLDLFNEGRLLTIKGWKSVFNPSRAMELLRPILNAETKLRNTIQDIEYDLLSDTGITSIYAEKWDELQKNLKDITAKGEVGSFEWNKDKIQKEIELYHNFIKERIAEINEGLPDAKKIKFDIGDVLDFDALGDALGDNYPQLKQVIAKIQKEYEKLIPTDITRLANNKLQEYADKVGISMDEVKEHLKTNEQSTEDWAKGLKGAYESAEKKLAEYKKSQEAFSKQGAPFKDWSEDIEETTKEMEVLKLLMDFFKEFLKGGDTKQRKSQLSILQEELQLHEKIYAKYKEYRQYMSAEEAKKKVSEYFKDTIGDLKFAPSFDKDGYKNVLTQYQGAIKALLAKAKDETERGAIKKVLLDLGFKINDVDWQDAKDNIEKNLKKLSDDLSRTKTAKEFFDRMLGMTGDKQLSATLTMSVYGTTGDDLKSALVKQVQGAFAGQDLSKAINTDLNSINLSALREIYNNLPEDFQEKQKQSMKQVLDMLEKGQHDLASNFAKLLMDYDEMEQKRVTITQKATQEIATLEQGLQAQIEGIRQNEKIVDKDSAIAEATARAEAVRKAILAREKLELSKLSPEYIRFFSSINAMAMETANSTRTQLRRALFEAFEQGGISAEELRKELKAIDTQFNKLNENASIFASYATGGVDTMVAKLRESADELDAMAIKMKEMKSLNDLDESEQTFINRMLNIFGDKGQKSLSDLTTSFNGDMSQMGDAVADVGSKMQGMFSGAMGALSIVDMIIKAVHQSIDAIQQVLDQINSMRSEDNQVGGWFKYISDFDKYVMSGWENLKSGNIAGALADTASSIISIFQNIQSDKLKRLDDDIERQQELLDNLAYSYERLEKAQEKSFGSEYISNYKRQLENLQAQQDAYLAQADAERSKGKKADEDKIKDYEDQARDTVDAIEDMYGSLSTHFLGTDLTSAARDFASAWIDAYKEFSNTTDAMKAKFQDMIQNMIVESLLAKVMEKALEPVFTMIDEMQEGDFYSTSFWQRVMSTMQMATENGVVGAENVMSMLEQMGINLRGLGGEMTGISRDIATASEESILGLAAGINTQNFYISQVPTKLDTIIGLLRGDGAMPQGSAITLQDVMIAQNQFLSHLPTIAQHTAETVAECKQIVVETRRTADALDRVIKPKGTQTTHTLNTTIN